MRIGILGTADIAFRRFLPALQKCPDITYAGVASRTREKAMRFAEVYGGEAYSSYDGLLADEMVDAVYVPLPPALHYEWGKKVLESGKHLLMEKPFTTSLKDTEGLLRLAQVNNLAVHENYMFLYHSQFAEIREMIADGILGELRLIRAAFGFPKRGGDDFRYKKALGGGALLDCGGYPVRLALELLGGSARVTQAKRIQPAEYEVDLYGNAVLENVNGLCAQLSFGMDNAYQCQLEVWGSRATLTASRIFTAGPELRPPMVLRTSTEEKHLELDASDSFMESIRRFADCAEKHSETAMETVLQQARCVEDILRAADSSI